jgi:hypothetical protein
VLERRALHQAVGGALNTGVGLYRMSWPTLGRNDDDLANDVLQWCRTTLSNMQRPYGVDSVSFALVAHNRAKRPLASVQFSVLRPVDFYAMGTAESSARDVLQTWHGEGMFTRQGTKLSALLFSWGDLTKELVLAG